MKVFGTNMKTSKLTGAALDWAVAKCEGIDVELISARMITERRHVNLTPEEVASLPAPKPYLVVPGAGNAAYSTDWAQGGPIIEREGISTSKLDETLPDAMVPHPACWSGHIDGVFVRYGPTPLIAAMRCYVASKLGDDVDVPEELI